MSLELMMEVYERLQQETPGSISADLRKRLVATGSNPFTQAADADFSNSPADVHAWLSHSLKLLSESTEIRAMYVEMNGYEANFDRWFCSPFGYSQVIDSPEPDELADYDASLHFKEDLTLTGMEKMQDAYRWWEKNYSDHPEANDSETIASLLVQTSFLSLIRAAVEHAPLSPSVSVAAATHGSDLVLVTPAS